jgi:hypothetical protein
MKLFLLGVTSALLLGACAELSEPSAGSEGLQVSIAPLTLPGLSKVCYDLRVTNAADGGGSTVFSKGNAALDGSADSDSLCSSQFGNGSGGGITFVGACDASPATAGDTGRTNSVTLWVDSLYATGGGLIAENGPDGWQDPCPTGCTLNALCVENTDTKVEFNLTILRQANQGFFDISVNFEDIFCSAKVDCVDGANAPLKLLFRPGTSTRDTTVVAAFACTAGAGAGISTHLYRDPLKVTCGATVTDLAPHVGKGNAWATSAADPNGSDAVWQYAIYADEEALTCNGQPCNKRFWNVAIGLDPTFDNCALTTRMTASSGALNQHATPIANTYPFIDVNVPLTNATGLTCTKHPLNGNNGVQTSYTPITTPEVFDYAYNGTFSALSTDVELALDAGNASSYPGTGTTWTDLSGKGRHATLHNDVGFSSLDGGALVFDGANDYVSRSSPSAAVVTWYSGNYTIDVWFKSSNFTETSNAGSPLVGHGNPDGNVEFWSFGPIANGKIQWYFYSGVINRLISSTSIAINTWTNITFTKNGTTLTIYINGVSSASTTLNTSPMSDPTFRLLVGSVAGGRFSGRVGSVKVLNRALSSVEALQTFNNTKTRFGL